MFGIKLPTLSRQVALAALLPVLLAAASTATASCPPPHTATTILSAPGANCVLRDRPESTGDYAVFCTTGAEDDVLGMAFSAAHALLSSSSLIVTTTWGLAVDAVGVDRTAGDKWAVAWQRMPSSLRSLVHWRFLDLVFGSTSSETPIVDPTANEDYTRWGHSLEVLPTTKRVVDVFSLFRWLPANSCNGTNHREWRSVINVRDSSMNLIAGVPEKINANDGCSYTPYHAGSNGWGEEMPDVSASWFLSDFFVVTWYDRVTCSVYARMFNSNGAPITNRLTVDSSADPYCSGGGRNVSRPMRPPGGETTLRMGCTTRLGLG